MHHLGQSKIDELTTAISMMSDDITKIVKGESCIQDLLKTIQELQKENERYLDNNA